MTTVVNMHEAKTQLSELVRKVQAGGQVTICVAGKPAANLVPIVAPPVWPSRRGSALRRHRAPTDKDLYRLIRRA